MSESKTPIYDLTVLVQRLDNERREAALLWALHEYGPRSLDRVTAGELAFAFGSAQRQLDAAIEQLDIACNAP